MLSNGRLLESTDTNKPRKIIIDFNWKSKGLKGIIIVFLYPDSKILGSLSYNKGISELPKEKIEGIYEEMEGHYILNGKCFYSDQEISFAMQLSKGELYNKL